MKLKYKYLRDPPGELMNSLISLVLSWASKSSSWLIIASATKSSMLLPRKTILSLRSNPKESASAPFIAVAGVCGAAERTEPRAREGLREVLREWSGEVEAWVPSLIECREVEEGFARELLRGRRVEGEETEKISIAARETRRRRALGVRVKGRVFTERSGAKQCRQFFLREISILTPDFFFYVL